MRIFENYRANKQVRFILVLLCVVPWLTACANDSKALKPPLEVPFALDKGGEIVELELRIIEKQTYTFGLGFIFNNNPQSEWKQALGSFGLRFPLKDNERVDQSNWQRVFNLTGDGVKNTLTGKYANPGVPLRVNLKIESSEKGENSFELDQEITEIPLYANDGVSRERKIANILLHPGLYKIRVLNVDAAPAAKGTPINFHIRRAYLGK